MQSFMPFSKLGLSCRKSEKSTENARKRIGNSIGNSFKVFFPKIAEKGATIWKGEWSQGNILNRGEISTFCRQIKTIQSEE